MNKFKIAIKALMLTIVVVCTVGCTKPDDPNNSGSNGGGNNGGNNGGGNEQTYTVSVSADPTNGGSVNGGGTYYDGQSCTLRAVANSGYSFKMAISLPIGWRMVIWFPPIPHIPLL